MNKNKYNTARKSSMFITDKIIEIIKLDKTLSAIFIGATAV